MTWLKSNALLGSIDEFLTPADVIFVSCHSPDWQLRKKDTSFKRKNRNR